MHEEQGKEAFRPVSLAELEGPRRKDVEEKLQKIDIAKEKMRERKDAPGALAHRLGLNELQSVERRSKLRLPQPQVSDSELYEIARMSEASAAADARVADRGGVTGGLVGAYDMPTPMVRSGAAGAPTPSSSMLQQTPVRTPGGRGDAVMMEAENLARMRAVDTPVLRGGEAPSLHPSDFSGATPRRRESSTPSTLMPASSGAPAPATASGRAGTRPRAGGSARRRRRPGAR